MVCLKSEIKDTRPQSHSFLLGNDVFGKQNFNIKQLNMRKFMKYIKQFVLNTSKHLKYSSYAPAKVNKSFEKVNTNCPFLN